MEGFLWGLGTAIGELPPYFVARKASLLGQKHEELEKEEQNLELDSPNLGKFKALVKRLKSSLFAHMREYSFVTVTLMASIPNPLFDLAGLTCGHLLIPFFTFFLATCLGKAVIKVHLQLFLIIVGFSDKTIKIVLNKIAKHVSASLSLKLANLVDKQRRIFTGEVQNEEESNLLGFFWNLFLGLMILYFVASVVDSVAKEDFLDQKKQQQKQKKDKTN